MGDQVADGAVFDLKGLDDHHAPAAVGDVSAALQHALADHQSPGGVYHRKAAGARRRGPAEGRVVFKIPPEGMGVVGGTVAVFIALGIRMDGQLFPALLAVQRIPIGVDDGDQLLPGGAFLLGDGDLKLQIWQFDLLTKSFVYTFFSMIFVSISDSKLSAIPFVT